MNQKQILTNEQQKIMDAIVLLHRYCHEVEN